MIGETFYCTCSIAWFGEIAIDVFDLFVGHDGVDSAFDMADTLEVSARFGDSINRIGFRKFCKVKTAKIECDRFPCEQIIFVSDRKIFIHLSNLKYHSSLLPDLIAWPPNFHLLLSSIFGN